MLSGHACNLTSDCPRGQICDLIGGVDTGKCPVVGGLCSDDACGSDADCALGCCSIDAHKCTEAKDACAHPECTTDSGCAASQQCSNGSCRARCEQDVDCPGTERCFAGVCDDELGAACILDDTGACGNDSSSCIDVAADGLRVPPYCTVRCEDFPIDGEKTDCAAGFICDTSSFHCLKS